MEERQAWISGQKVRSKDVCFKILSSYENSHSQMVGVGKPLLEPMFQVKRTKPTFTCFWPRSCLFLYFTIGSLAHTAVCGWGQQTGTLIGQSKQLSLQSRIPLFSFNRGVWLMNYQMGFQWAISPSPPPNVLGFLPFAF